MREAVEMGRVNVVEANQARRSGLPSFVEMAQLHDGDGEGGMGMSDAEPKDG